MVVDKKRKTLRVRTVVGKINNLLASDSVNPDAKAALAILAEEVLMETGNYNGFKELPSGSKFYFNYA